MRMHQGAKAEGDQGGANTERGEHVQLHTS